MNTDPSHHRDQASEVDPKTSAPEVTATQSWASMAPLIGALLFFSVLVCRMALPPWLVALLGTGTGSLVGYGVVFGLVPLAVGGKTLVSQAFGSSVSPQNCLLGLLMGALNYVPCLALAALTEWLLGTTTAPVPHLLEACSTTWDASILILALVAMAPLLEEAFFRGILQPLFAQGMNWRLSLVLTSGLFALIHLDGLSRMLPRLEMGLVFGALALITKSIWPAVFAHATHNLLGLLADTFTPQESLSQIHLFPHLTAIGLLTLIPLVVLLRKLAHREAWPRPESDTSKT